MSEETLKIVITGDVSDLDKASGSAIAAINRIIEAAAAMEAKMTSAGEGSGEGIVQASKAVEVLENNLQELGVTANKVSVIMPSVMADRGQTITVGAKAVDELNTSLQQTGTTLSKIESEWDGFAQAPFATLAGQAAAFDEKVRRLNLSINYTDRSMKDLGTAAKRAIPTTVIPAVERTEVALTRMNKASASSTNSLFALSGIVQDAPYGFRAIANNITFFTQQMAYSAKASGGFGAALKGMGAAFAGPAGIIFAISAGVSLLDTFLGSTKKTEASVDELAQKVKDLRNGLKSMTDVQGDTIQATSKQSAELNVLYGAATDVTRSEKERLKAAKDLQSAFPKTFGNISQLKIITGQAAEAFNALTENILKVGKAQAILSEIVDNYKSIGKATGDVDKMRVTQTELFNNLQKQESKLASMGKLSDVLASGSNALINAWQKQNGVVNKARNDLAAYTQKMLDTGKIVQEATADNERLKKSFDATDYKATSDKVAGAGSKIKTVSGVMADLAVKMTGADSLAKVLGLSIEQVGALKMKALSDAMNNLAYIATPAAIQQAKALGEQYDKLAKATFLPILTGGRAQVNAPGITNPGVPKTAIGSPNLNTDSAKVRTAQQKELNDQFRDQLQLAGQLDSIFGDIFSTMANGGNALQGLIQAIEQLIIKLAAAAAAAAILNALTGGGAAGFGAIFGQLSGLTGIIPSHAQGGYIPGPQLAVVGDAPGGEWVLNQKQISAILNGSGQRNSNMPSQITLRAAGADLVAVIDTNNRKQNRRG